jgi:hypothetical protein
MKEIVCNLIRKETTSKGKCSRLFPGDTRMGSYMNDVG